MAQQEAAEALFRTVTTLVDASARDLVAQEPSLRWVLRRGEVWAHVLKIASLAMAASRHGNNPALLESLDKLLLRWSPTSLQAMEDVFAFIGDGQSRQELPERIGIWVLWNVKGTSEPPAYEESLGALKVGHYCLRIGGTWDLSPVAKTETPISGPVALGKNPQSRVATEFLQGTGGRPYRDLIETQMRRLPTDRLMAACNGEIQGLPAAVRGGIEFYVDQLNSRFGYDQGFWKTFDCNAAFYAIMDVAIASLPIQDSIPSARYALNDENQELAFSLFQIATLSFACSASTQRAQRKFMGIRKGIFG